MTRRSLWALTAVLCLGISIGGCNCGNPPENSNVDGGQDAGGLQGDGGGNSDGGPGQCVAEGGSCDSQSGVLCCVGSLCENGVCSPPVTCHGTGAACTNGPECCSGDCVSGQCSSQLCKTNGNVCANAGECCSSVCNGSCQPVPGATCGTIGQACTQGSECCSTDCQGGRCVRAYTCQASGDICFNGSDCCSGICNASDGGPGLCQDLPGGCTQDGNPCSSGTNCCSRTCTDPGTGAKVCQPAGGCRMTGASCPDDQACCGGGTNPNGSVQCTIDTKISSTVGVCNNGQSCNPVGNICGAAIKGPDGGVIIDVNASQNCCDGKVAVCKADSTGIPRCFGGKSASCPDGFTGAAGCCIADGQQCQFKDQCCGGAPCLPGADGGPSVCTVQTCKPLGAVCVFGAGGCCAGTVCGATSETTFACKLPSDGGTGLLPDGGSVAPDAGSGTCKANGSGCATGGDCCSTQCVSSVCQTPTACQPAGLQCSSSADCCTGLGCQIPAGSIIGTCTQASCVSGGQSCSVGGSACCTGYSCQDSAGTGCLSGEACTCKLRPN